MEGISKNAPLVSVIIPVYNVEPYLQQCIDSILCQTMKEIEIILIDDGSLDGCPQICDQYAGEDGRVRVVHQANAGVSAARNLGMKLAVADWIFFVDPDDWLESCAIKTMYRRAVEEKCDIVVCGGQYNHYPHKLEIEKIDECETGDFLGPEASAFALPRVLVYQKDRLYLMSVWGKLYRKACLETGGCRFLEGLRKHEDKVFNLYAFQSANKISVMAFPVYHYRRRNESATQTFFPDEPEQSLRYISEVRRFLEKYPQGGHFQRVYNGSIIGEILKVSKFWGRGICCVSDFSRAAALLKGFCRSGECAGAMRTGIKGAYKSFPPKCWPFFVLLEIHMYHLVILIRFFQARLPAKKIVKTY